MPIEEAITPPVPRTSRRQWGPETRVVIALFAQVMLLKYAPCSCGTMYYCIMLKFSQVMLLKYALFAVEMLFFAATVFA